MKKLFSLRKIVCLCLALIMTFSLFTVSAEPTVDGTADAEVETADEETSIETELRVTSWWPNPTVLRCTQIWAQVYSNC